VFAEHGKIEYKSGRVFVTALSGDVDDFASGTAVWLGEAELRPGVAYMVAPGSILAFGESWIMCPEVSPSARFHPSTDAV
jgi:hypothetical protein